MTDYDILKNKVIEVVSQKADDVCWLDSYKELASLVGVKFDPELLPRERFLSNCSYFYDCLAKGQPYSTPCSLKETKE